MSSNLTIKLTPTKDKDGATYYVGRLKFDGTINCKDGVVFFIFNADKGDEQLQIAPMHSNNKKTYESKDDDKTF